MTNRPRLGVARRNLITNPSFELGSSNWNSLDAVVDISTATPADGTKVGQETQLNQTVESNEFIPISEFLLPYTVRAWIRHLSGSGTPSHYIGVACYDSSLHLIGSRNVDAIQNTETTLAADLHPTDTTVVLADATNWTNSDAWIAFDIENDGSDLPNPTVNASVSISSISGNTLNMTGALGISRPAGTKVRMHHSGAGTFNYCAALGITTPSSWQEYIGQVMRFQKPYDRDAANLFRIGTKYVRAVILPNFPSAVSGDITQFDAAQFYSEAPEAANDNASYANLLALELSNGIIRLTDAGQDLVTKPFAVTIGATTSKYLIRNPVRPSTGWPTSKCTIEWSGKLAAALGARGANTAVSYYTSQAELAAGFVNVSGAWKLFLGVNNNTQAAPATGASTVPDDLAYHKYAITWNNATGAVVFYIDGVAVFSATGFQTSHSLTANGSLVLGQAQGSLGGGFDSNLSWNGDLDEIRIYNRVLNATEVAQHFEGHYFDDTGLCAAYGFDDVTRIGYDESGVGNDCKTVGITELAQGSDQVRQEWIAIGGQMDFGPVDESSQVDDMHNQGVDLKISGVDQTVLAALLTNQFKGRYARYYRAYFDKHKGIGIGDPYLLIDGLQFGSITIDEQYDAKTGGSSTISVRIASWFGPDRTRGIISNMADHQRYYPGDTFFRNSVQLQNTKIYWAQSVPVQNNPPGTIGPIYNNPVYG